MSQISPKRAAIDWDEVRARLQKSEQALQESLSDNPGRMQAVFRRRAVQLAQEAEAKPASQGIPALVFRLGQERYAVPLEELAEVLPFRGCTGVPGGSERFLGVINLRGQIRPVIDLARVLCGSASTDSGAVLILRRPIGLKVDAVENLQRIRSDEMAAPVRGHFVRPFLSGTLALLDLETLLSAVTSTKEPGH
ncbi:MAG TPA: chemotaxis protein CheW [Bryobacteraceae bacterium]